MNAQLDLAIRLQCLMLRRALQFWKEVKSPLAVEFHALA
jgi:hypothetical protein